MKKILYFIIPLFLLVACGEDQVVKDARARATAAVIFAQMTPISTATPIPFGTPTMSIAEFSLTQVAYQQQLDREQEQKKQDALGTQQANEQAVRIQELKVEQAAIKATSDAAFLQAEKVAAEKTAVAYQNLMTAQAGETAAAVVLATKAENTAIARSMTAAVEPTHAIWTQEAITVIQTVEAGQAKDVDLAVKRTTATNMLVAYGPWALLLALSYVGARGFSTYVKTRTHARDEHGRSQTFQRELPDGGVIFVKPEQMETGIIKVTGEGEVVRYGPMDKEEQAQINRGNTISEIVSHLPIPYAKAGQVLFNKYAGEQSINPSVRILSDARALSPVLDEAEGKLIEE